ncbi:MAG: alanine racemase, partial [Armatimonadetes bacterium]|nr:alanine racemase [Anaerolineae bacterium]
MHITELDTPALIIDLDIMEANIRRMQARCAALGIAFRPHIKTHKMPQIAWMQVEAGAVGIACQKVSEAEVFAAAGLNDLQIPYNIVGARKTARLTELALYNRVTVSVDHISVIAGLADATKPDDMSLRVLVELATPMARTGAQAYEVVALAQRIEREDGLHFAGLTLYPSHLDARATVQEALHLLHKAGIGVDSVVGSGVGAPAVAHDFPELTELRVGTYVFNDWRVVSKGLATLADCALTIAATVVSRPTTDRVILDSGSKTLSSDVGDDGRYAYIVEYPDAKLYRLNEEHGYADFSACDDRPVIGETLHLIPAHVCTAVNMHDQVYAARGGTVEAVWQIAGRGKVW